MGNGFGLIILHYIQLVLAIGEGVSTGTNPPAIMSQMATEAVPRSQQMQMLLKYLGATTQ